MPTEKPKIILVVTDDMLKRIDDFRFENRISSRSKAIRLLIEGGLKLNSDPEKEEDSDPLLD
ncbi:MAG: hypothetical protein A4E66_01036 [Syntrophus sp. PtaB.Bin001]|jgi:metal-responsive CopG/Arc/MetJ family transcriptional regulator|nr:MAG: hypothetical protein A4E66_01036 [Syntrophus sp. PtaB.Bin001]